MDPIFLGILITIAILFGLYMLLCIWLHFDIILYYIRCKCCYYNQIRDNEIYSNFITQPNREA
jgi:hypothetical protein